MTKEEETVAPSLAQNYARQARDQVHPKERAQPNDGCLAGIGKMCGPMNELVEWAHPVQLKIRKLNLTNLETHEKEAK